MDHCRARAPARASRPMRERKIRVLVTALPPLVHGLLVGPLGESNDIELLDGDASLERLSERARLADVVVLPARDGGLPEEAEAVLAGHSVPVFLAVEVRNGQAHLVRLTPSRTALGPVTPDQVVGAIREVGETM
jgi:hypothetical protein